MPKNRQTAEIAPEETTEKELHQELATPDVLAGGREPEGAGEAVETTLEEDLEKDRATARRLIKKGPEPEDDEPELEDTESDAVEDEPSEARRTPAEDPETRQFNVIADSVLKRGGWSERRISAALKSKDPEDRADLERTVRKMQRQQKRTDETFRELDTLKRATPAEQAQTQKKESAATKLAAHLKEIGDEPGAAIAEQMAAEFEELRKNQQVPASDAQVEDSLLTQLREPLDDLARQYPELKKPEDRRKLVRTANHLAGEGIGGDVEDILEKAAVVLYGNPKQAQRRLIERNREERNGQPDIGGSPPSARRQTEQDLDRAAAKHLMAGKSPQWVNRWKHQRMTA